MIGATLLLLAAALLLSCLLWAAHETRRAVAPAETRACLLRPRLDRMLGSEWSAHRHLEVALILHRYGHHNEARLHQDIAGRLEVWERLERERQAQARAPQVMARYRAVEL